MLVSSLHPSLRSLLEFGPKKRGDLPPDCLREAETALGWETRCAAGATRRPPECSSHGLRKAIARRLAEAEPRLHKCRDIRAEQPVGFSFEPDTTRCRSRCREAREVAPEQRRRGRRPVGLARYVAHWPERRFHGIKSREHAAPFEAPTNSYRGARAGVMNFGQLRSYIAELAPAATTCSITRWACIARLLPVRDAGDGMIAVTSRSPRAARRMYGIGVGLVLALVYGTMIRCCGVRPGRLDRYGCWAWAQLDLGGRCLLLLTFGHEPSRGREKS